MKTFAFIDVQNTDTTTKKLLGFKVDWQKLYNFLKSDWGCEKVFLYTGVDEVECTPFPRHSHCIIKS